MAGKGASEITLTLDEQWMKRKEEDTIPEDQYPHHSYRFKHDGDKQSAVKLATAVAYKRAARVTGHIVTDQYIYLTSSAEAEDLIGIATEIQGGVRQRAKARQTAAAPPRMSPGRPKGNGREFMRT